MTKYKMFGDTFEKTDKGIKINGNEITKDRCEELYQNKYKHVNIIYRPAGVLFYQAVYKHTYDINNFRKVEE